MTKKIPLFCRDRNMLKDPVVQRICSEIQYTSDNFIPLQDIYPKNCLNLTNVNKFVFIKKIFNLIKKYEGLICNHIKLHHIPINIDERQNRVSGRYNFSGFIYDFIIKFYRGSWHSFKGRPYFYDIVITH